MAYKFFDKKSSCGAIKSEIILNQQLADKLHKLIIRNIQKRKVYPSFKDSILVAELADMQLLSKYNKRIYFLLCAFDIYGKYAGIVPLKYEKGITITNAFQKVINESGCKPNKIWVDKGSKFCNSSMKSWFQDNDIEIYSTHKEGKSVVVERFIRTLKNKIYKYITSVSKNVYIDKLDDIVND